MKKTDYYKHAAYRAILFVIILFVIAQFFQGTEYAQVYNRVVIIFAVADILALMVDYLFFWAD